MSDNDATRERDAADRHGTAEPENTQTHFQARPTDETAPPPDPVRKRRFGRGLLNVVIVAAVVAAVIWLFLR